MSSQVFRATRVLGAVSLLAIGFFGGVALTSRTATTSPTNTSAKIKVPAGGQSITQAWNAIHQDFVNRNVNDTALIQGAVSGMVNALGDPYSVYFDPAEAKTFQAEIDGTFEGVGMEMGAKNGLLTIIAPLSGSPAEKAGLHAGDMVQTIDGQDARTMAIDAAVQKIRGPKGTKVTLTVLREGSKQPISVTITRDVIKVDSVTSRVIDKTKIGYIRINSFDTGTSASFTSQAKALMGQSITGLIVDLRGDPGGILEESVNVASDFIAQGTIVSEIDRNGKKQSEQALGNAFLQSMPTVALVDKGSASASEILAGALQDTKKATIVGETTFGKGSVQNLQSFPDGSSLKMTIAKWYTPNGRSISDHGIVPDISVAITQDDLDHNRDPQLDRAVSLLTK